MQCRPVTFEKIIEAVQRGLSSEACLGLGLRSFGRQGTREEPLVGVAGWGEETTLTSIYSRIDVFVCGYDSPVDSDSILTFPFAQKRNLCVDTRKFHSLSVRFELSWIQHQHELELKMRRLR